MVNWRKITNWPFVQELDCTMCCMLILEWSLQDNEKKNIIQYMMLETVCHTISLLILSFSILSVSFFCSLSVLACHVAMALESFWIFPEMDLWYSLKSFACCRMLLRYSYNKKRTTQHESKSKIWSLGGWQDVLKQIRLCLPRLFLFDQR